MKVLKKIGFSQTLLFGLLLVFILFLRWNSFSTPFERDEGEYAYSAWILTEGKGVPYKDSFLQKPPMIIYTYMLGYVIDSSAVWPTRVIAAVSIVISAFLVFAIVKNEYDEKLAWISAFFTAIVLSAPFYTALAANTELFLITPLLGVVYIYVKKKEKAGLLHWFIAGVLTSISLLYKPIGLYLFVYIFLVWIFTLYKEKKDWLLIIKNMSVMILGGVVATLLVLLPIFLKGAGKEFMESAVVFNAYYAKMWGLNLSGFRFEMTRLVKYWWILLVLLLGFFIRKGKNGNFFLGLFMVSILAVFQSVIGHYYLLILPFLVILASVGVNNISNLISKSKNSYTLILGIAVLFFLVWPIRTQFGLAPRQIGLWIYGTENPFNEADIVATQVAKITNPKDKIFIGGSEPEIYYYAKRTSVSRFVITYPLNLKTELREKYQKEAVEDLEKNNPEVIVVSQLQMSGLWDEDSPRIFIDYFVDLINKNYKLVGGFVRSNQYGYWKENPSKEEVGKSSLLVYRKI